MSKFCTNCGSALDDEALFCSNCNTAVETDPVEVAPVEATPAGKPKLNAKLIGIGAAVLAVVIILSCLFLPTLLANPESALDNLFAVWAGDESKVEDLLPTAIWGYVANKNSEFDMDEFAKEYAGQYLNVLKHRLGEGIRISYDVKKKTALKEDELEYIAKLLNGLYGINKDDVKDGYTLNITRTIEGAEDYEEDEVEFVIIKIGDKWYNYTMFRGLVSLADSPGFWID